MIALCTGMPAARERGCSEQILVNFPSGEGKVQVALSLNQALRLLQEVRQVTLNALDNGFAHPPDEGRVAELIALRSRS